MPWGLPLLKSTQKVRRFHVQTKPKQRNRTLGERLPWTNCWSCENKKESRKAKNEYMNSDVGDVMLLCLQPDHPITCQVTNLYTTCMYFVCVCVLVCWQEIWKNPSLGSETLKCIIIFKNENFVLLVHPRGLTFWETAKLKVFPEPPDRDVRSLRSLISHPYLPHVNFSLIFLSPLSHPVME